MKVLYESKCIKCDCGQVNHMDTALVFVCPCCEKSYFQCECTSCEPVEIPALLHDYVETYQDTV